MKVKPNQLVDGCILTKDVFALSNLPIMRKKTVVTDESILVLEAYLVDSVDVAATLATGEPFIPKEIIEGEIENLETKSEEEKSFIDLYLEAVREYNKLFLAWQAGSKVEILKVRKILLPLVERVEDNTDEIISIHHYATKKDYISHHAISVGIISAYLGYKLNYEKAEIIQLGIAGTMADSGMSKISNRILTKKNPLSSNEFEEIRNHPLFSYQMLKDVTGVTDGVLLGVLQHHEREDGSGYPMGVQSQKLHKFSQIIAAVDVFHAMTSERYYKQKQSPYKVIELIEKDHFGKFDMKTVKALASLISNFSVGTKVRLNNEEIGEIVFLEPFAPIRPMIKLETSGEFIKLVNRNELFIEEIIR